MRRIKLVLAAVAALVAMLAVVPGPAMAQDLLNCEFVGYDTFENELYLCGADDVVDDFGEVVPNCALIGYDDARGEEELYLCEVDVEEDADEEEEEDSLFDEDDEEEEDSLFDEDDEEED